VRADGAQRFAPRDRIWLGVNSIQLATTADPVDVAGLRARVAALAEQEPSLRYFSTVDPARPDLYRHSSTPAQAAAVLAERGDGLVRPWPAADVETAVAELLQSDDGLPVPVLYAGRLPGGQGLVGHRFPHVLGDGLTAMAHLRRLVHGPDPASRAAPWPVAGVDKPLDAALRERYRGDLRRLLTELRAPRPSPSGPALTGSGPDGAGPDHRVEVVVRHLGPAGTSALKEWRKAHQSGVSMMTMVAAAVRRGLADTGLLPAEEGMFVAFDLRTFLPRGSSAGGNFISVTWLAPADPLSPRSVEEAISATSSSGRPLLGLAVGAAKEGLRRSTPVPVMPAPSARRDVAFSHMRVGKQLPPALLAAGDDPVMVVAGAVPSSVGGISVTIAEIGEHVTLTAVFCSPHTPRDPVVQVLDRFAAGPADLLG
jgi:hypothetical protein